MLSFRNYIEHKSGRMEREFTPLRRAARGRTIDPFERTPLEKSASYLRHYSPLNQTLKISEPQHYFGSTNASSYRVFESSSKQLDHYNRYRVHEER